MKNTNYIENKISDIALHAKEMKSINSGASCVSCNMCSALSQALSNSAKLQNVRSSDVNISVSLIVHLCSSCRAYWGSMSNKTNQSIIDEKSTSKDVTYNRNETWRAVPIDPNLLDKARQDEKKVNVNIQQHPKTKKYRVVLKSKGSKTYCSKTFDLLERARTHRDFKVAERKEKNQKSN